MAVFIEQLSPTALGVLRNFILFDPEESVADDQLVARIFTIPSSDVHTHSHMHTRTCI
jgi:hypothetical protein